METNALRVAAIIEQGNVSDGYDIVTTIADGSRRVFHFLTKPTNPQQEVDALAASLPAEDTYVVEGEI